MTRFWTTTALVCVLAGSAGADVINASSQIDAATVFPQGAAVSRIAPFEAAAGTHSIEVRDLPQNLQASSLRVTGAGDAPFRILSVNHRIDRLPPADPMNSPGFVELQVRIDAKLTDIETLQSERRVFGVEVDVANGRLRMVEALMTREPQRMVDDVEQGADPLGWAQTITVLAEQMDVALRAKLAAETEIAVIDEAILELRTDIARLQQEQAAIQLPPVLQSVATIEIAAQSDVSGTLELSYRDRNAGWAPVYDLRLEQGEVATLDIERHARIWQNTGENWDDVAVTLSTARTTGRMEMPEFDEYIVTLGHPILLQSEAEEWEDQEVLRYQPTLDGNLSDVFVAPGVADVVATREEAQVVMAGRTVTYALDARADIDGDGTVRQLLIDAEQIEADTVARATPRLDPNAYLYALATNSFGGPILPGRVSTYLDGAFVGEGMLPFTAVGAELDLPFGQLDGILISAEILDREQGDYGLLSTTNTQLEAYRLTAESVLDYGVMLTLFDRAPVSESDDLQIDVSANLRPTEEDVNGRRGVTAWTFELPAGETQEIEFGYEMWWPGDETLITQ